MKAVLRLVAIRWDRDIYLACMHQPPHQFSQQELAHFSSPASPGR